MWIAYPVIQLQDGTRWAVTVITWRPLSQEYDLRLRRGYEDKFMTIAKDDYDGLVGDGNPQQPFDLRGDEEEHE